MLPAAGDLCADCRHDAADARRRAVVEQADQERRHEEQQRRDAEGEEEEARRASVRREEMRRAQAEEERRQQEERERRLRAARHVEREEASTEFDPYLILGIEADATADRVQAAYEAAQARYDPREYEHFGIELQEHFKAKAAAVERAYAMLALPE